MFSLEAAPTDRIDSAITNAMTVDVEDYFQVSAFENHISRGDWDDLPCRVEMNTDRILAMFAEKEIRATFFVLGWVAERYPNLIRRIVNAGHELACHGYEHIRVSQQTPSEFQDDITRAKVILEDLGGVSVNGYRAPSYSIGSTNFWAFDQLSDAGFVYSSSIYPIKHDLYGMPGAPRFAFRPTNKAKGILEIPVTTFQIGEKKFPCGGGGYFRLLPYPISKWSISRVNNVDKQASVFYFHPWEIDAKQPRQENIGLKTRFRHYLNLSKMEERLNRLLDDFRWDTMERVFLSDRSR